ncbi:hypothetical protein RZS08_40765, partial [Arthrospira platensis SPKY1]|nr:hypothetical protein [Arthrospira platensis SPKY1]
MEVTTCPARQTQVPENEDRPSTQGVRNHADKMDVRGAGRPSHRCLYHKGGFKMTDLLSYSG